MPSETRKRGNPLVILACIIGVPLIPAIALHYFIRTTPPGANTSPLADEVAAALDRIPAPSGDPEDLRFNLTTGEAWVVATDFDSPRDGVENLPEGAAPDLDFRDELALRGGRFRFEVAERLEAAWRVRITALEGADARFVGDGLDIVWGELGDLTWHETAAIEDDARVRSVREALAEELGIRIVGWFERPVRRWDVFVSAPTDVSFKAVDVMGRLDVTLGDTSIPPQGGLFHAGLHEDGSGRRGFQWVAYRRRTVTSETWAGRIESVWNGDMWAPADALHLAGGEVRLNEVFRLRRGQTTIATANHTVRVRQTTTRE